jgi:hypothetical protein
MSINIGGNILAASGFTTNGEINDPNVVTDGLVLWYDPGNFYSYALATSSYYDCGYGCQYYASDPGCNSCTNRLLDMSGNAHDASAVSISTFSSSDGINLYFPGDVWSSDTHTLNISGLTSHCISTMTYEIWVNLDIHTTDTITIFGNNDSSGNGVFINASTGATYDTISFIYFDSGHVGVQIDIDNLTHPSVWNHLVFTTSGTTGTVLTGYVNGVYHNVTTRAGEPIGYGSMDFVLGDGSRAPANKHPFQGYVGPVRVYNRILSITEIVQNFNAGRQRYGV